MAQTLENLRYGGFPSRMRLVAVPAPLLGSLLERIDDIAELKCTLRAVSLLSQKRGYPRFVSLREMQADEQLARAMPQDDDARPAQLIEKALAKAARRGTLAFVIVGAGDDRQPIFGLNAESDRAGLARLANQPETWRQPSPEPADERELRPNVFEMYEQNIGLLSPMIADELREAEEIYPEEWIEDAIGEAVAQNKRSWRYASKILQRWEREGRGHGRPGRNSEAAGRY